MKSEMTTTDGFENVDVTLTAQECETLKAALQILSEITRQVEQYWTEDSGCQGVGFKVAGAFTMGDAAIDPAMIDTDTATLPTYTDLYHELCNLSTDDPRPDTDD